MDDYVLAVSNDDKIQTSLTVSIFSPLSPSPVPFCAEAVEEYVVASREVTTGRTMSWMMSFNPTS